jgi:glycerol-3-phosphate acyltransferase PlsY
MTDGFTSLTTSLIFAFILFPLAGYLSGSVSGAHLFCKLFRLGNPSNQGSRNPGATNVYRLGGKTPALLTLIFDAGKAAIPISLTLQFAPAQLDRLPQADSSLIILAELVALSVILGHLFPVFHHFQGGKGVATALGAGLVLTPISMIILSFLWGVMVKLFHKSSIASVVVALIAPLLVYQINSEFTLFYFCLSLMVIVRHRSNLIKLLYHQENSL